MDDQDDQRGAGEYRSNDNKNPVLAERRRNRGNADAAHQKRFAASEPAISSGIRVSRLCVSFLTLRNLSEYQTEMISQCQTEHRPSIDEAGGLVQLIYAQTRHF